MMQDRNSTLTCEDFTLTKWTLEDAINDERLQVETFYASALGIAVSVASSLVSTCASILVIYIIMRSVKGLKESVYHRILFGMSIFDILQSLAIAFVTLPMPKDMIYQQFQGPVLGNDLTCSLQGLLVTSGSIAGIMYNLMLSIYYLCSIRYDMPDKDFSKRLERWLHAMCICFGFLIGILILYGDGFNPNPAQNNWCAPTPYPYYCSSYRSVDKRIYRDIVGVSIAALSGAALVILISCMVLIVLKVRRQEEDATNDYEDHENNDSREQTSRMAASNNVQARMQQQVLNNMKAISRQALAYTIVNLFSYTMIFFIPLIRTKMDNPIPPTWFQVMVLSLRPLQGLFNCIIFIYHKVDSLRKNDGALLVWPALKMVMRGEEGEARIVSDLIIVRHHTALSQIHFADEMAMLRYFDEDDGEEEDKGDEENSSFYPRPGDESQGTSSSSKRSSVESADNCEANGDTEEANEDTEEANEDTEEASNPISTTSLSNVHAQSSINVPDQETTTQAQDINTYQGMYYQYRMSTSEPSQVDDEPSQDLSGFQSSSQPLSVTSDGLSLFSWRSKHSNCDGATG